MGPEAAGRVSPRLLERMAEESTREVVADVMYGRATKA
jgi:hypothetical protein